MLRLPTAMLYIFCWTFLYTPFTLKSPFTLVAIVN